MGTKKGRKLIAIQYMEERLGLIVIPKSRVDIDDISGAFTPSQVRKYLPMEHINPDVSGFVEKDDIEEAKKKKEKDLKPEPYIKDE